MAARPNPELTAAIEAHKAARAAVEADKGPHDISPALVDAEDAALYAIAHIPCADDAQFFAKLSYMLAVQKNAYRSAWASVQAEEILTAIDLHLNSAERAGEGSCPVVALADEACRLLEAYDAAERASINNTNPQLIAAMDAAYAFRKGLEEQSTFLLAKSAKGALFHAGLLHSVIDDLASLADPVSMEEITPERQFRVRDAALKAERLLFSISGYIEALSGVTLDNVGGGHWLAASLSPFEHVKQALALLDDRGRE